jgi:hypothetical protein
MTTSEDTRDGRSGVTPLLVTMVALLLALGIGFPLAVRLGFINRFEPESPVPGVVVTGQAPNWNALIRAVRAYQQAEGASRRGPLFERAAQALTGFVVPGGIRVMQPQVQAHLGSPDFQFDASASGGGVVWAYLYNKNGTKNAAAIVHFDAAGNMELVRFGKNSAADFTGWQAYGAGPASRPATAPGEEPVTLPE